MAWQVFGTLAGGNENASLFDTLTAQIAKTVIVPCTASGTNTITLTGTTNAPAIASYSDLVTFSFLAAATSTGTVQALFTGLATLGVYLGDGTTVAAAGNLVSGQLYTLTYSAALAGGSGGFYLGRIAVPVGVTPGVQLIQRQIASNNTSIDFTTGIDSSFGTYICQIQDFQPAVDSAPMLLRVSEDGGSTWIAANYSWNAILTSDNASTPVASGNDGDSSIHLGDAMSNVGNRSYSATLTFWNPSGTARSKVFMIDAAYSQSGGGFTRTWRGSGVYYGDTGAINGIRFLCTASLLAVGTFTLYGMPNS